MNSTEYTKRLKTKLRIQEKTQNRNGVYGYTQRSMAYNSNRIEGSTLTERQTASIFETGTLYLDKDVTLRNKDIEELTGHFKMFNYTLNHVDEPLSEEIIKTMHKCLKEGVFEDLANGFAVGDYKKIGNFVSDIKTALPQEVPERMQELLIDYHSKAEKTIDDIAQLHANFEKIHPFQDGNGRVGRMIIFKECLANNLIPVIIRDDNKPKYMSKLHDAQVEGKLDGLADFFKEEQKHYYDETFYMVFDMDEIFEIEQKQNNTKEKNNDLEF